nr:MAG TPA: hypothetical protein [Microviridae sp.]
MPRLTCFCLFCCLTSLMFCGRFPPLSAFEDVI